jgi:hypothetical protein
VIAPGPRKMSFSVFAFTVMMSATRKTSQGMALIFGVEDIYSMILETAAIMAPGEIVAVIVAWAREGVNID